jgi:hypothetical protein
MTTKQLAPVNDDEFLSSVDSFAGAIAALEKIGATVVDSDDLGHGFKVTDKATLVKVPMLIMGYRFQESDTAQFVTVFAVTEDDRKVIFNDGGTGIYAQLQKYNEKAINSILLRDGLTRSDYQYADDKGVMRDATTYYLST